MEGGGKQFRLLGRLLGKLRGEHGSLEKQSSMSSTAFSDTTMCENPRDDDATFDGLTTPSNPIDSTPAPSSSGGQTNTNDEGDDQLQAHIDLRYGGQYLTPEQLPEFCDQLHNLVEVIRNIQSYAKLTGEYPSNLENRLQQEAEEVAALAAEARNARDVIARTRVQRRAVRAQRKQLLTHLVSLRETEIRELESTVRLSDRKLFKSWESLKDSSDPSDFEPLLNEIKMKQAALEGLVRLIENRQAVIMRKAAQPHRPQPLPPPLPFVNNNEGDRTLGRTARAAVDAVIALASGTARAASAAARVVAASASNEHRREGQRANSKRRRKEAAREPRSVPVSVEPSHHTPPPAHQPQTQPQSQEVHSKGRRKRKRREEPFSAPLSEESSDNGSPSHVALFIQGTEHPSRYRVGSAGAVAVTSLDLPSRDSVRDIIFFTSN